MILICGTNLEANALPFSDVMAYKVVPPAETALALKVTAKAGKCVAVYVSEEYSSLVTPTIQKKTTMFKDDDNLLALLSGSGDISLEAQQAIMEMDSKTEKPVAAPVLKSSGLNTDSAKSILSNHLKHKYESVAEHKEKERGTVVENSVVSEAIEGFSDIEVPEVEMPVTSEVEGFSDIEVEMPVGSDIAVEMPTNSDFGTAITDEVVGTQSSETVGIVTDFTEFDVPMPKVEDFDPVTGAEEAESNTETEGTAFDAPEVDLEDTDFESEETELSFDDEVEEESEQSMSTEGVTEAKNAAPLTAQDVENEYVSAQERRIRELEKDIEIMSQERADPVLLEQLTEKLKATESSYSEQLKEKEGTISDLTTQNVSLKAEIDRLQRLVATASSTVSDELAAKQAEIDRLQGLVATASSTVSDELTAKQAEIDRLQGIVNTINSECDALKLQVGEQDKYNAQYEQEKLALEQQIIELTERCNNVPTVDTAEIERLQQAVAEKETANRELQIKLDTAYAEVQANERKFTETQNNLELTIQRLESNKQALEQQIENMGTTNGDLSFYDGYAENVRALISPEQEDGVLSTMDFSDTYVCSFGTGESLRKLVGEMYHKLFLKGTYFIVDMTFDIALTGMHRTRCVSIPYTDMAKPGFDLKSQTIPVGGSVALLCGVMHDIGLLTFDWGSFLQNVKAAANGRQIIILLPPIASFAVKYVFTKLGINLNGAKMLYALIGNPHIVQQSLCELRYLPNMGLKVLVSDCPTDNNKLLLTLKKAGTDLFETKFFKETIDFSQVGLTV